MKFADYGCRLECDHGFVSDYSPIVSCIEGKYNPTEAYKFKCEPAIALAISTDGQMEMVSETCNKLIPNIPDGMTLEGHSLDLIDDRIVLGPVNVDQEKWMQYSLAGVRGGSILGAQWESVMVFTTNVPQNHISTVHNGELFYIGGKNKAQLVLKNVEKGDWNTFNMIQKDSKFQNSFLDNFVTDSCSVKHSNNELFILGGVDANDLTQALTQVRKINMNDKGVLNNGNLKFSRSLHACETVTLEITIGNQVVSKKVILVSGGVSTRGELRQDEIFDFDSGTSEVLAQTMTTPRYGHRLINLGGTVYAMGGKDGSHSLLKSMEKFTVSSKSWSVHNLNLLSSTTYGLAVTGLPSSAIDCGVDCKCGKVSDTSTRILGGSPAEVNT